MSDPIEEVVAPAAIERALGIYRQLRQRDQSVVLQARKILTQHIFGMVDQGEQDEQRLTVGGLVHLKAIERESSMSKAGLDNRHRNKDGEISGKHGNTLIRTLRKIYGQNFAAGYAETEKLGEVLLKLNETSLSQLRRDHETGHLGHKIASASK